MSHTQVAAAVIVMRGGKILLLQRKGSEGSGTWAIPGGKVDFMEDPRDSVIRELEEETGLKTTTVEFVGYTSDVHQESNKHFVTLRFVCTDFVGEPVIAEPEKCTAIDWFDPEELPTPLFGPTEKLLRSDVGRTAIEENS